jgi:hypothetical protein
MPTVEAFGSEAAMRVMMSDPFSRFAQGAQVVALVALAWAILVPGGLYWNAVAAVGLVGAAIATTLVVRSRQVPTLAQVMASALAETPVLVPTPAVRAAARSAR